MKRHEGRILPFTETFPLLQIISELPISNAQIDIGRLAVRYWADNEDSTGLDAFLRAELAPALNNDTQIEPRDVVLYGFGRIGRLLARLLVDKSGASNLLRLRAIVVRGVLAISRSVLLYYVVTRYMASLMARLILMKKTMPSLPTVLILSSSTQMVLIKSITLRTAFTMR